MKKSWIIMMLLASLLVLASCGGSGGGSGDDEEYYYDGSTNSIDQMVAMDIEDAQSLFINTGNGALSSSSKNAKRAPGNNNDEGQLFKITTSGKVEKVDYYDKNKNKINTGTVEYDEWGNIMYSYGQPYYPVLIKNINENYVIIGFSWQPVTESYQPQADFGYIVRKTDGAVYKLSAIPYSSDIHTDSFNNIYYISWMNNNNGMISNNRVVRVNLSLMSSEYLTPQREGIETFEVDNFGNILYRGWSSTGAYVYKLRKRTGTIIDMELQNEWDRYPFWKGIDGNLYFYSYHAMTEYPYTTTYSIKTIDPVDCSFSTYGTFLASWNVPDYVCRKYVVTKNGTTYMYLVGSNYGNTIMIDEVYNSSDNPPAPKAVSIGGLNVRVNTAEAASDEYLYFAGKSDSGYYLVRVTPGGTTLEKHFILDYEAGYEVYSFTVSETDGIIFNALRKSDGREIIGKISTSGGPVIVLSEEIGKIYYLERIR